MGRMSVHWRCCTCAVRVLSIVSFIQIAERMDVCSYILLYVSNTPMATVVEALHFPYFSYMHYCIQSLLTDCNICMSTIREHGCEAHNRKSKWLITCGTVTVVVVHTVGGHYIMLDMVSCSPQIYWLVHSLKTLQNYWNRHFRSTTAIQNETNSKNLTMQTKATIRKWQSRKMGPTLQKLTIATNKTILSLTSQTACLLNSVLSIRKCLFKYFPHLFSAVLLIAQSHLVEL